MNKILIAAQFPPPYYGQSIMVENLSKIKIDGIEIHTMNLQFNKEYVSIEKFQFKKLYFLYKYLIRYNRFLAKKKIDLVIICNSFRTSALFKDFLFVLITKRKNIKVIFYSHGQRFYDNFYLKRNLLWRKIIDRVLNKVDYIVTISKKTMTDFTKWFDKKNIFYIYNGIEGISQSGEDCEKFLTETGRVKNFSGKKNTKVLYLSTITKAKGIFVLLDAIKVLKDRNDIEFNFCGDFLKIYPHEKELILNYIKENGFNNIVKFSGRVEREEKNKAFNSADIFVFPSLNDAMPLVVIEAMSAGLPVITTSQGALPEFFKDGVNGFFIAENDPEALAEKILILKNNPKLRSEIKLNNEKLFREKFTLDFFNKNWINLLENIFSQNLKSSSEI